MRLLLAAVLAFALASCSSSAPPKLGTGDVRYEVIHVDVDGRQVPCVVAVRGDISSTSIDCDWTTR